MHCFTTITAHKKKVERVHIPRSFNAIIVIDEVKPNDFLSQDRNTNHKAQVLMRCHNAHACSLIIDSPLEMLDDNICILGWYTMQMSLVGNEPITSKKLTGDDPTIWHIGNRPLKYFLGRRF